MKKEFESYGDYYHENKNLIDSWLDKHTTEEGRLAMKKRIDEEYKDIQVEYVKKQTSVEWLFQKLWDTPKDKFTWYTILKGAKEMEKQQIIEAAKWMPKPYNDLEFLPELAKQYYNETYK